MKRSISIAVAAAMAFAGTFGSLPSALALPVMQTPAAVSVNAEGDNGVIQVKARKFRKMHAAKHHKARAHHARAWHGRSHGGHRYLYARPANNNYRYAGHRRYGHHYGYGYGYGYHHDNAAVAIGVGAVAVGVALAAGSANWNAACAAKYGSFDPASGTYLGFDGYRHRCVLP